MKNSRKDLKDIPTFRLDSLLGQGEFMHVQRTV